MKQTRPVLHARDHLPGGADPVIHYPTGDTIDDKILAALPAGFGQDLSTTSPELDPLWGAPPGPPGEQTANFETGTEGLAGTASRVSRDWPTLTGDFTAAVWVNRNSAAFSHVMGQGNPTRGTAGTGWQILLHDTAGVPANVPLGIFSVPAGEAQALGLNPLLVGVWAFLAVTYNAAAAEFRFYVDGLLQGTPVDATGYEPSSGKLWVGHDGGLGVTLRHFCTCRLSYAFLVNRTMSGTELEGIVGAPSTTTADTDTTGWVPTDDGSGSIVLQPPGIEVEHGDGTPDPEPVTSIWAPSGSTSVSGWHLDAHYETVVLYDSSPGRFDVPSMKWVRVPFNTVRIWRTWEPTVGATSLKTEWLPDDRGLTTQAKDGLLQIAAGMEGTPDADGHHQTVSSWAFSPEWPFLDWRKLPNGGDPLAIDNYVRAARVVDLSHGFVLRDYGVGPTAREFFEWSMFDPADGTPEWVSYTVDNPYPVYPVWPERPLVLPPPYPKMSDTESGAYYAPFKEFRMKATLAAGSNLCVQAWQDAPWLLRFSTDTYRIPYPGLSPKWGLRPYLTISYSYDPETIDHTTGTLVG